MKIGLISDLHLEMYAKVKNRGISDSIIYNHDNLDVLVIAGDSMDTPSIYMDSTIELFEILDNSYRNVIMVMGNHEHYYGDFCKTEKRIRTAFENFNNITLLEKQGITINGIRFFGGTMWTNFDKADAIKMFDAESNMSDYRFDNTRGIVDTHLGIESNPTPPRLTALDTYKDNAVFITELKSDIEEHKDTKYVIVSHHSPSYRMEEPCYMGSRVSSAYHSDRSGFILDHPNIKFWLHGHTHQNRSEMIGGTTIACNARGYPNELAFQNMVYSSKVFFI